MACHQRIHCYAELVDAIEALEAELAAEPYAGLRYMLAINDDELLEALVALRKARGLTREQVAERMNRSVSVVADFERPGVDPHLSTIRRYAVAIGASIETAVADFVATTSDRI